MSKRIELARRIKQFLSNHAVLNPDFDPEYDDEYDKFASPDAGSLFAAYTYLIDDNALPKNFRIYSSWESGGYKPYSDRNARLLHDDLVHTCRELTAM